MSTDITFVLTSCGRFDLLAETPRTFVACNTAPIARYVLVEDSGDASVRDAVSGLGIAVHVIVNESRLGQMASIDRAYRTVGTPYTFHCKDDWRFFRPGFVEESRAVLEGVPSISLVNGRRLEHNPCFDADHAMAPLRTVNGIAVRVPSIDARVKHCHGFAA